MEALIQLFTLQVSSHPTCLQKIFGEEVSSTIETLIVPEVLWPRFALRLAASAFISSWASSGFGCAEDNHLEQAIRIYNSQVSTS